MIEPGSLRIRIDVDARAVEHELDPSAFGEALAQRAGASAATSISTVAGKAPAPHPEKICPL